ncbi:MAG TPA: pilus assembly PilX N-terminal domain-containing protein [Candidatus Krumholzibacteria bacterium]|nr:pilus assembly PilX N-terminal domain-containing protein [Candidatus Krumholzibacteria bacterium]
MGVRSRQGERGAALILALAMLLALGFIGAALIYTAGGDLKMSGADRRGTQAQFSAEAGVQEALARLSMRPGTDVTVNGETFDACIRDTASTLDPDWEVQMFTPGGDTPTSANPSTMFTPTVQPTSSALDYVRDDNLLVIRHKWRDLNGDNVRDANEIVRYDGSLIPPENMNTGSTIEVIEVSGYMADARRRLRVEVTRFPFSPNIMAALECNTGVDIKGTVNICGHNHSINTPENTNLESAPTCSPTYDEAFDHLPAVMTTGDEIEVDGSTDLLGEPGPTDSSSTNPFYSLAEALGVEQDVVDQILADPDHTSSNDASPLNGITFVNGDATGSEKFNSVSGEGLLYVAGDLDISGGFSWVGLVYVDGDVRITGNAWVLGAMLVQGESDVGFGGGNPSILYSRDAIRLALELAFDYIIISWKEL